MINYKSVSNYKVRNKICLIIELEQALSTEEISKRLKINNLILIDDKLLTLKGIELPAVKNRKHNFIGVLTEVPEKFPKDTVKFLKLN